MFGLGIEQLVFIGIGLFSMVGALSDWDWFMNSRRARFFVRVFGRTGARIFYALLGVFIIALGLFFGDSLMSQP